MDDKFIYYLVLGAIYLISRMLKKKKPVAPNTPRQQEADEQRYVESESQQPNPQPQKQTSFEDLLKEISQEFTDRREPEPRIEAIEEPVEIIEPVVAQPETTREEKYVERRHREIAAEDRAKKLKRLEEKEEHEPDGVLELLQEDGGAANAIILSEIFNRKY